MLFSCMAISEEGREHLLFVVFALALVVVLLFPLTPVIVVRTPGTPVTGLRQQQQTYTTIAAMRATRETMTMATMVPVGNPLPMVPAFGKAEINNMKLRGEKHCTYGGIEFNCIR